MDITMSPSGYYNRYFGIVLHTPIQPIPIISLLEQRRQMLERFVYSLGVSGLRNVVDKAMFSQ